MVGVLPEKIALKGNPFLAKSPSNQAAEIFPATLRFQSINFRFYKTLCENKKSIKN
jgi:hypothetical protein